MLARAVAFHSFNNRETMHIGTLRRWQEPRGFGFIEYSDGDCFAHLNRLRAADIDHPHDGMVLEFDIARHRSNTKMQATDIRLVEYDSD